MTKQEFLIQYEVKDTDVFYSVSVGGEHLKELQDGVNMVVRDFDNFGWSLSKVNHLKGLGVLLVFTRPQLRSELEKKVKNWNQPSNIIK